jgi:hypothetical protein
VQSAGVGHVHAVDLFKRTRAFKGWPAEQVNAFAVQLDGVIARHLQLGFSVIVRDDDYRAIYAEEPKPRRSRLDSKYGVCFRACLAFVPSFIASELRLTGEGRAFRSRNLPCHYIEGREGSPSRVGGGKRRVVIRQIIAACGECEKGISRPDCPRCSG